MRLRVSLVLLFLSCATVKSSTYEESLTCPANMDEQQAASGVVRCRALCSSYARDFAAYGANCRCYCMPPASASGYRPSAPTQM